MQRRTGGVDARDRHLRASAMSLATRPRQRGGIFSRSNCLSRRDKISLKIECDIVSVAGYASVPETFRSGSSSIGGGHTRQSIARAFPGQTG